MGKTQAEACNCESDDPAICPQHGDETARQVPTTVPDYHADQIGRAVLAALNDVDAQVWFDVGMKLASDDRVRAAIKDAIQRAEADPDA